MLGMVLLSNLLTEFPFSYKLSIPMSSQGLSIAEAAESLGVSTRTVRRFIKAGKIKADLVDGPFGQEYRIAELPEEVRKSKAEDNHAIEPVVQTPQTSIQSTAATPMSLSDLVRELQEKNLALAAQLGAATERIRSLEKNVRLLSAPRLPWWKRLFGIKS